MREIVISRQFDLIAIGSSAGGIDALKRILPKIRKPFRPSVVVVQHIAPMSHATLADFFRDLCEVPVKEAEDKEPIASGTIYFAPAGYHLLIEKDHSFALNIDRPVQFARPSIDVLMESVAGVYTDMAAGFVLTGSNSDGAEGLRQMQKAGGLVVVQRPETAEFSFMPGAALAATKTVFALTLSEIEDLITGLG
jgi:two-component system chemotaxis response regulator CheB